MEFNLIRYRVPKQFRLYFCQARAELSGTNRVIRVICFGMYAEIAVLATIYRVF